MTCMVSLLPLICPIILPRKNSDFRENRRGGRGERGDRGGRGRGRGDRKTSDSRKRVYRPRHNDDNSIYVGNLSFKTTEMKLGRHFE